MTYKMGLAALVGSQAQWNCISAINQSESIAMPKKMEIGNIWVMTHDDLSNPFYLGITIVINDLRNRLFFGAKDGSYQVDPDPAKSARDVRDAFGRMGMNDSQTVLKPRDCAVKHHRSAWQLGDIFFHKNAGAVAAGILEQLRH